MKSTSSSSSSSPCPIDRSQPLSTPLCHRICANATTSSYLGHRPFIYAWTPCFTLWRCNFLFPPRSFPKCHSLYPLFQRVPSPSGVALLSCVVPLTSGVITSTTAQIQFIINSRLRRVSLRWRHINRRLHTTFTYPSFLPPPLILLVATTANAEWEMDYYFPSTSRRKRRLKKEEQKLIGRKKNMKKKYLNVRSCLSVGAEKRRWCGVWTHKKKGNIRSSKWNWNNNHIPRCPWL